MTAKESRRTLKKRRNFAFSRQQENITHQYPDIIEGLKKTFRGEEAIIEGEVVAYDEKKKTFAISDFNVAAAEA